MATSDFEVMMLKVLLTGGTGFLGSALISRFLARNYEITLISNNIQKAHTQFGDTVKVLSSVNDLTDSAVYDVIINLAGAPIFGAYWTIKRKVIIKQSRINLTQDLVAKLATLQTKPKLLISGSAIGYYGEQGDNNVDENTPVNQCFSQQLCVDWEDAALKAEQYGIRVCLIRTGLVLGRAGGFLQPMILPFKLGLGGRLGTGQQWMSWIHINDWLAIVDKMIVDEQMQGAYNATATNPVRNQEFSKVLAHCFNKPAFLPVPSPFLKLLLGEMSELLLGSQQVLPKRLTELGFTFEYCDLASALKQVLGADE